MPKAYRIVNQKYAARAFDGEGARLFGGRWNERGVPVVYTSSSASLAVLETFVHMGIDARTIPHVIIEADIPESFIKPIGPLPEGWNINPAPEFCQKIGSAWAREQESAVLALPSVMMPSEMNYLINPYHPDFANITIAEPKLFIFDDRMWKVLV